MYTKRTDELTYSELWEIIMDMTPNMSENEREDFLMNELPD